MTIYDAGYTFVVVKGTLGVISCLVICFRVKILQNHRYADSETAMENFTFFGLRRWFLDALETSYQKDSSFVKVCTFAHICFFELLRRSCPRGLIG